MPRPEPSPHRKAGLTALTPMRWPKPSAPAASRLHDVFDRTRLRVARIDEGRGISWDADKFKGPFTFFNRAPNAPAATCRPMTLPISAASRSAISTSATPYFAALYRDTIAAMRIFLAAYPNDAMARRVRAIGSRPARGDHLARNLAGRHPQAYWSIPCGAIRMVRICGTRVAALPISKPRLEPPPTFTVIEYDVPPPQPTEIVFVDRHVLYFDDADFGYAPPPPPVFWPRRSAPSSNLRRPRRRSASMHCRHQPMCPCPPGSNHLPMWSRRMTTSSSETSTIRS